MRNQAYFLAACAAAVIGCGGGHHSNRGTSGTTSTTGTTGTTGNASGMTVTLPNVRYGRVDVSYLTGENRAPGDVYLEITRQRIQNADNVDVFNRTDGLAPINLLALGFQTVSTGVDVDFQTVGANPNSFALSQLVFDPNRLLVEQETTDDTTGANTTTFVEQPLPAANVVGPSLSLPATLDARIRAFPGRVSLVQVRVNAGILRFDAGLGSYVFDQALFRDTNALNTGTDPTGNTLLASRLSDFVRFGLAQVPAADRPFVRTDYGEIADPTSAADAAGRVRAGYVYATGDNFALSTLAAGAGSSFEEIDPTTDEPVIGNWYDSGSSQGSNVGRFTGTYNLTDANPTEVNGVPTRLVSMFGIFRDYTEVLSGGGTFEMVMFPNSGEQYDANRQGDVVAFVRNSGGQITQMFTGGIDLTNGGASNTAGSIQLLPVFYLGVSEAYGANGATDGVHPPVAQAVITGTVSGYTTASGASATALNGSTIRRMRFSFDAANSAKITAGSAALSGTVTVFRS